MDPSEIRSFLPYLVWLPVAFFALVTLALAPFSRRPAFTLRRGGSFVLVMAGFTLLFQAAPHGSVPAIKIFIGVFVLLVAIISYYLKTPMQRKYGSMASILAAHRAGDHETVLRLCDDPALQRQPGIDLDLFRGASLYHLRRLNEAESYLRGSLTRRHAPVMEALIFDQLGQVFMEQGRSGEAIDSFQRAEQLDPSRGAAFQNEAEVYLRGKYQLEKALELAQRAVDVDRKQSAELRAVSLSTSLAALAWALAANGRTAEARESIQEALGQSKPDSIPIQAEDHYLAGRTMLAIGDQAAASEYFQKVSELDPKGNFGYLARQELAGSAPSLSA